MASHSRGKLPNLKICVDNTNDVDSEDEITEEKDIHIIVESKDEIKKVPATSKSSSSGSDSDSSSGSSSSGSSSSDSDSDSDQSDAESVEFNVRISGLAKDNSIAKRKEIEKRYENKAGNFVTGIDLTSKEAIEKKDERAKRFGITTNENTVEVDRQTLFKSLGIKEEDITKGERGIRLEAIHMRGTDNMSTQDIFQYFSEFAPGRIEWIDDSSCNVVWFDPMTVARALTTLSTDYNTVMKKENGQDKKTVSNDKPPTEAAEVEIETEKAQQPENKESKISKEEEMDVDDELDLNADTDNEDENTKESPDKNQDNSPPKEDIVAEKDDEMDTTEEKENKEIHKSEKKERNREKKIIWPPGKWRLGQPSSKAKFIFLRFATKADKKVLGAENKSKYYIKHGNPNYGGQKGLISASRKRKIRAKRRTDEYESVKNASNRQEQSDSDVEEVEIYEKPKELFTQSNKPRAPLPSTEDIDDLDMEAELQELLGRPIKKRSMRMYADDIEDAKRESSRPKISTGGLTIMTESRPSIESRLGREVDSDRRDARFRITDARDRLSSSKRRKHSDYTPYNRPSSDLRSRLTSRRPDTPPDSLADIKIEIFE